MIKLLVVDDEIWIRERISKEIPWESVQAEVVGTAEDGQEALEMAEELEPDIIITDIRMPGFDGIELLRELRKKSLDIKVILLSGYNDFSYAKEAIKYGAFDYVLKPAEDQELLNVVNRCVMTIEIEREKEEFKAYKRRQSLDMKRIKNECFLILFLVIMKRERMTGKTSMREHGRFFRTR